jgi:hypothetical protein
MAQNKIEHLTDLVEKLLTREVAPVAPVLPVAPIAPIVQQNTGDHDLLTKLDTKVDQIQLDVTELKKDKNAYINQTEHNELVKVCNDHETRVRILEKSMWKWVGVSSTIAVFISIIVGFLEKFIK